MLRQPCRQISIGEADCKDVFYFDVPVPEVPAQGATIQIICAGVCYKRRISGEQSTPPPSPAIKGIRDSALFPGYEVAGVIDKLGPDVPPEYALKVGQRVVVYPYEGLPSADKGYSEYIPVPDARYLVKVPDNVPMHVAAMLPSGAVWAINAIQTVLPLMDKFIVEKERCNVLIVGTGGLAFWTIRIAKHYLANYGNQVKLAVAALKDDALGVADDLEKWNVVSWSEDVYESHLVERTKHVCGGPVDIVLDFGASHRSLLRALKCMRSQGVILVGDESYETLSKRMENDLNESEIELRPIAMGSLEQLTELVNLISEDKISAPPCNIFSIDEISNAVEKLSKSTIKGCAVLQFNNH